jgi:hypothetical protein
VGGRLLTLAAAAATAGLLASPALAQTGGAAKTITFREVDKGSRFQFIDHPPLNKPNRRPTYSVGDEIVFSTPLADASGRAGELRARCTMTHPAPASDRLNLGHPLCVGAFVLRKGALFVDVVDAGTRATHGAITGGTGAYVGARGTLTSTNTRSGSNDVVTLLP